MTDNLKVGKSLRKGKGGPAGGTNGLVRGTKGPVAGTGPLLTARNPVYPLRRNDYQNNSVNIFSCNCPGAITGFSCRASENNSPKIVS